MYLPAVHVEKELGVVGVVNVPEADAALGAREALCEEGGPVVVLGIVVGVRVAGELCFRRLCVYRRNINIISCFRCLAKVEPYQLTGIENEVAKS